MVIIYRLWGSEVLGLNTVKFSNPPPSFKCHFTEMIPPNNY